MKRLDPTKSRIALAALGAACLLASTGTAWATDYDIRTNNSMAVNPSDGLCTFPEAVEAVNSGAPFNECTAVPSGDGSDRILLKGDTYQTFNTVAISASVQIIGAGTGLTNLDTGGVLGLRVESPTVDGISVKVTDLTIRGIQPTLPVTCVWASGYGGFTEVELEKVRVTACNNGGVDVEGNAVARIRKSTIEKNKNTGIRVEAGASLWMHSSLVYDNSSSGVGGGIAFEGSGNSNVHNSTITANKAGQGGGVYYSNVNAGYLSLHNTTVASNTATDRGGGLLGLDLGTPMNTYDSIVAQNTAPTHPDISGKVNSERSLHGNTTGNAGTHTNEAGLLNVNPLLGPLMDMGGPTRVLPLLKGSPALDARSSAGQNDVNIDQRGFPRPVNTNEDLGAFEQGPLETELLAMEQKTAGVTHSAPAGSYSNGFATRLHGTASNQFVTYRVPVAQTGNHNLKVRVRKANNHAIWQLATASTLGGSYSNIGAPQDHFSSSATTVEIDLGTVNATSVGQKYFRFTSTGKHGSSSGFNLIVDYIKLTKL